MNRLFTAIAVAVTLTACAPTEDLSETPVPIGDFRLGHNIALAEDVTRGPFSRDFETDTIEATVQDAVASRLRRYDGDGLYHLGIVVGGIVLAQPGIPVVYAPSSVLVLDVTIFDNETRQKLNEEPERIQVGEGLRNAVPIIGSGMVRGPEEQLANLSENAALQIENWLKKNPQWFAPKPGQVRVPYDLSVQAPDVEQAKRNVSRAASN